jgi:hypothetical protein
MYSIEYDLPAAASQLIMAAVSDVLDSSPDGERRLA